ncbi:protein zwilch homolog [Chanos chanos]|uniref:Protein zwilch n=1 Tax=Chanos chanos TaxID=29144 RepID=A0A6J2UMF9_CHACN|nr:protein zwilch homolog [Chanos chanos]
MGAKIIAEANNFTSFLKLCQNEDKCSTTYEDMQILLVQDDKVPLDKIYDGNRPVFVCQRTCQQVTPDDSTEDTPLDEGISAELQDDLGPQPLTIMRARQLLSWYTMSQNPNMPQVDDSAFHPIWIRCDMNDPAGTTWMGAETVHSGSKVAAVKLYSVCSKGATADKASFITLDELKQEHQKRHHPSAMVTRGWAQYNLFGSTTVENTIIESQSSITVSFTWNNVEKILETPPLSSLATLNIRVAVGDMRSPMFQTYKELEFLQILADGLKTGETEWLEPLETQSAVDLTRTLIEELENIASAVPQTTKGSETNKVRTESSTSDTPVFNSLLVERGDLDFTEQLWVKMRRSVTSYQDIRDCLKMVIKAVKYGQIKPWIHRDSSSSLSKLILQSYQQQMEPVPLTGLTPVHMLLEMGLDKMRKDYINYLVGKELTTLNNLSYYLNTEVDLQEQVMRVRKLHHLLEILGICSTFLSLPYERLFLFTQSCLQYYKDSPYDETHEFKVEIKPALISYFYQKEQPLSWGVEVSSGQGLREVRTSWHLSDKPLVDHVTFDSDVPLETTVNGESEETSYYRTLVCCSLVNFT